METTSMLCMVALACVLIDDATGSLLYLVPAKSNPPYHRASMVSSETGSSGAGFTLRTADPTGFTLRTTLQFSEDAATLPSLRFRYTPTDEPTIKKWQNTSFEAIAFFEEVTVLKTAPGRNDLLAGSHVLEQTKLSNVSFLPPVGMGVVSPPDTRTYAASIDSYDRKVSLKILGSETSLRTAGRAYVSPLSTLLWIDAHPNVSADSLETSEEMVDRLSVLLCAATVTKHPQDSAKEHFVSLKQKVKKKTKYHGFFSWAGSAVLYDPPAETEEVELPLKDSSCSRVIIYKKRPTRSNSVTWALQLGIGAVPPTLEVLWWTVLLYVFAVVITLAIGVILLVYSRRVQDAADVEEDLLAEGVSLMGEINNDSICGGQVQSRGNISSISTKSRDNLVGHLRRRHPSFVERGD